MANRIVKLTLTLLVFVSLVVIPTILRAEEAMDLQISLVDQQRGIFNIDNKGHSITPATTLAVSCSLYVGKKHSNCAEMSPHYHRGEMNQKLNGWFMLEIPAMKPGEVRPMSLWKDLKLPQRDGEYMVSLTIDAYKKLKERNRQNNTLRYHQTFPIESKPKIKSSNTVSVDFQVTYDGQSLPANITITPVTNRRQTQIKIKNDLYAKSVANPLHANLLPGKYRIQIQTRISDNHMWVQSKPMDLIIGTEQQQTKTIDIPVGYLEVKSNFDQQYIKPVSLTIDRLNNSGSSRNQFTVYYNSQRHNLPATIKLPAGDYKIVGGHPDALKPVYDVVSVNKNKSTSYRMRLVPANRGELVFTALDGNNHLINNNLAQFLTYQIVDKHSGKKIDLVLQRTAKGVRLPEGEYRVIVQQRVLGGSKQQFDVQIQHNKETQLAVRLLPAIVPDIKGRWSGLPRNLAACAEYHSVLNTKNLGSLMGGGSASRGQCYDEKAPLVYEIEQSSNPSLIGKRLKPGQALVPGQYQLKIWPFQFPELSQSVSVKLTANKKYDTKILEFPWPYKEVEKNTNGKIAKTLIRKNSPAKERVLFRAFINGEPTKWPLGMTIFQSDYNGNESVANIVYQSGKQDNIISPNADGSLLLPEGDYSVHAGLNMTNGFVNTKKYSFTVRKKQPVNHTFNFETGTIQLNISEPDGITAAGQWDIKIYRDDENHSIMLKQLKAGEADAKILLTGGNYTLIIHDKWKNGSALSFQLSNHSTLVKTIALLPKNQWDTIKECLWKESIRNRNYADGLMRCHTN